ncbi:MAG: hypothetical protein WA580_10615 [Acidimicrobiales bacterium]
MLQVTAQRCRTYRYRLHPTVRQAQALSRQLEFQREQRGPRGKSRSAEVGAALRYLL